MNPFLNRPATPWIVSIGALLTALTIALAAALFGFFHSAVTIIGITLCFGGFGLAIIKIIQAHDWLRLAALTALTLFAIFVTVQTEPTVFNGRDQGAIAIAAKELATGHELAFRSPVSDALFAIYGPGRALNFPGFSYTDTGALITQFPIGYISYLALFISWFGVTGYAIANGLLFILSGWSMLELGLLYFRPSLALFGTALFSFSFITIWLAQMTLTENLALMLFLTISILLIWIERSPQRAPLAILLLASFLFALTRIEGFVIALLVFAYTLSRPKIRTLFLTLPKTWIVIGSLSFGFILLRDFFMNLPFYTMIGKAVVKSWNELNAVSNDGAEPALGPILFSYGLFPVFLLGITSLLLTIAKRRFALLIPAFIALPTLVYLINGHISDDHPWLLRRYAFTLWPLLVFFTTALMAWWADAYPRLGRYWIGIICLALLAFQAGPAYRALATVEYQTLRDQSQAFGAQFSNKDLILIDRTVTGDPFAMIAGPLANFDGKAAVYFFNPEDLDRIDRQTFDQTFLVTTEESHGRYTQVLDGDLLPVAVHSFTYPTISVPHPYAWPTEKRISTDVILFRVTR